MYCNSCGKPNPDGSSFCSYCGKSITSDQSSSEIQDTSCAENTAEPVNGRKAYSVCCGEIWRRLLASPLILTFIIIFSAVILLNLWQTGDLLDLISTYTEILGLDMPNNLVNSLGFGQVIMSVPSVLIAIGMWLLYIQVRDINSRYVKTTGFSLIRGALIANIFVTFLLLTVCFFVIVGVYSEVHGYKNPRFVQVESVLLSCIGGILIVGVLSALYYILIWRVVNNAKRAAEEETPDTKCITALAVIQFVTGGISVIGAFSSELSLLMATSASVPILCGVVLLKYEKTMQELKRIHCMYFEQGWSEDKYLRVDESGTELVYDTIPPWEWRKHR